MSTEIPVVLAIDPDVADTEAAVVPDATFSQLMPVVGLLVTLAEVEREIDRGIVDTHHRAANRLQCRHARRDGHARAGAGANVHRAGADASGVRRRWSVKMSRSVNARSPETLVSTTPAPAHRIASVAH